MANLQKIVTEISFNRIDDREEFGEEDRIASINRFTNEGRSLIGITFLLGRHQDEDDTISLVFSYAELMAKIIELEIEGE